MDLFVIVDLRSKKRVQCWAWPNRHILLLSQFSIFDLWWLLFGKIRDILDGFQEIQYIYVKVRFLLGIVYQIKLSRRFVWLCCGWFRGWIWGKVGEVFNIYAYEGLYISTEKIKYGSGLIKSHVEFFLQEVESTQPSQWEKCTSNQRLAYSMFDDVFDEIPVGFFLFVGLSISWGFVLCSVHDI